MRGEPETNSYLTAAQVARKLNLSNHYVYRLAREKRIPSVRIGRYVRFSKTALKKWLERKRRCNRLCQN